MQPCIYLSIYRWKQKFWISNEILSSSWTLFLYLVVGISWLPFFCVMCMYQYLNDVCFYLASIWMSKGDCVARLNFVWWSILIESWSKLWLLTFLSFFCLLLCHFYYWVDVKTVGKTHCPVYAEQKIQYKLREKFLCYRIYSDQFFPKRLVCLRAKRNLIQFSDGFRHSYRCLCVRVCWVYRTPRP